MLKKIYAYQRMLSLSNPLEKLPGFLILLSYVMSSIATDLMGLHEYTMACYFLIFCAGTVVSGVLKDKSHRLLPVSKRFEMINVIFSGILFALFVWVILALVIFAAGFVFLRGDISEIISAFATADYASLFQVILICLIVYILIFDVSMMEDSKIKIPLYFFLFIAVIIITTVFQQFELTYMTSISISIVLLIVLYMLSMKLYMKYY